MSILTWESWKKLPGVGWPCFAEEKKGLKEFKLRRRGGWLEVEAVVDLVENLGGFLDHGWLNWLFQSIIISYIYDIFLIRNISN